MKKRTKPGFVLACATLMLMMVTLTACSHDTATSSAKTPNPPGSNMTPDDQVKQHVQQQGGQTATPNSSSGTSSGQ